jgi:hypothetical protein
VSGIGRVTTQLPEPEVMPSEGLRCYTRQENDMHFSRYSPLFFGLSTLGAFLLGAGSNPAPVDPRMRSAYREPDTNGWVRVHLEGTPSEIGYQHGTLLASEIEELVKIESLELQHDTKKGWGFFRREAQSMMWPHIEAQYREELQGIADGVRAKGGTLDIWDIVALNGCEEWEYYTKYYDTIHGDTSSQGSVPEHCSAFVATGRYTRDGRPVIAHNNWSNYMDGERWRMVFEIVPDSGYRIVMDGLPGVIVSDDDFGINSAGLVITETTISGFAGYDPDGIPEFVRARKAMQYAASIDDFTAIMKEGNNGGYANDWLVADMRSGEIASLELGLKNVTLERTRDGCFVGANFPINPKLAREETTFDPDNPLVSGNARHVRWKQLMDEYEGSIDVAAAKKFLADHYDVVTKTETPSERTLCGHIEASPRGMGTWQLPYGPAGAAQNKVTDATLALQMEFVGALGHACGTDFVAEAHLQAHPGFEWQRGYLRDMPSRPWTVLGGEAGVK